MSAENGKSFLLYIDQYKHIRDLADEYKARLLDGIFLHAGGEQPQQLEALLQTVLGMITNQIDRDKEKYAEVRRMRSEAGKKGMQSRYAKRAKALTNDNNVRQTLTNLTVNVNESESETENDKENVNDIDSETVNDNDSVNDSVSVNEAGALPRDAAGPPAQAAAHTQDIKPFQTQKSSCPAGEGIALPLKDGTSYGIGHRQLEELQQQYAGVDVPAALDKLKHWLADDPARLPGRNFVMDRVGNWLAREQPQQQNPALNYCQRRYAPGELDYLIDEL